MPTHHKLPLPVDAVQLSWRTWNDVCVFLGDAFLAENPQGGTPITASMCSDTCGEEELQYISLNVRTIQGEIAVVRHGDWIIRESVPGRFCPVRADVFARTYGAAPQDACTMVTIDGEDIRVHGRDDLTDNGREALGALLEVARRKMESTNDGDLEKRSGQFNSSAGYFNSVHASDPAYLPQINCPLCAHVTVLDTPAAARAHFGVVHPECHLTGSGPWPLLEIPEKGCAHCGGNHAWNDCEAYAELVRADASAGLVERLDGAVRDVLSGAFGTFLDCGDAQAGALHHMLVSAMAAEVHRKMPAR